MLDHDSPIVTDPRSVDAELGAIRLDARLAALRDQLGEVAWRDRVVKAMEREAVIIGVTKLMEQGASSAHAVAAQGTTRTTFENWRRRYKRGGLAGLIDRTGNLKRRVDPGILERSPPRHRTKNALSFVKWAGSKAGVMRTLLQFMPAEYGTYYEPFLGSGTVFFKVRPKRAVLGDINAELVNGYEVVRDHVDLLITALARHQNSYDHFVAVRAQDPSELVPVERAARLIYLNKTCYNGLYRVNRQGRFNVPYGRNPHANFLDVETLQRVSLQLQGVDLRCGDYRNVLRTAAHGDLVYLDPPYLVGLGQQRDRYQPAAFDEQAHVELADVFRDLDRRGCHVVLSNSDLPLVRELYRGYHVGAVATRRQIHWATDRRAGHVELVVSNRRPSPVPHQLDLLATRTAQSTGHPDGHTDSLDRP